VPERKVSLGVGLTAFDVPVQVVLFGDVGSLGAVVDFLMWQAPANMWHRS
jgi:hypothetical protein